MTEYNAKEDGEGSYLAAIEAKRARGDDYYLLPHEDLRLNRSSLESLTRSIRRNPSLDSLSQGNSSSRASGTMRGPFVGHEDFCGSLYRVHVDAVPAEQDGNGGVKPNSADHGATIS